MTRKVVQGVGMAAIIAAAVVTLLDKRAPPTIIQSRTPDGATFDSVGDTARLFYGNLDPDSVTMVETPIPSFHTRNRWGEPAVEVRVLVWKGGELLREDTVWRRP